MKSKLRIRRWGYFLAIAIGLIVSSCTKELETIAPNDNQTSSELLLKSANIPAPNDLVCDLIAGQTTNVGKVIYSHIGDQLLVEYVTTEDWLLSEVHFYVGTLANFEETCMNKKAIQIGKFPYSASDLNGPTHSFSIPLASPAPEGGYMVVAHAVVKKVVDGVVVQEETAFANCTYKPLIYVKSIFVDLFKYEPFNYAVSQGDPLPSPPFSLAWSLFAGTNIYEKGDVYQLKYFTENPGEVRVTDDGTNLLVTVVAKENYELTDTYLFVGSMGKLISLGLDNGGPNYTLFQNIKNTTATDKHEFSIPMMLPINISFETQFGSSRWGWFSYYNF